MAHAEIRSGYLLVRYILYKGYHEKKFGLQVQKIFGIR